jgi:hypothetical protein
VTTPDFGAVTASLAELEARLAAAEADGETLPPEAHEMLTRLRNLNDALASLAKSLAEAGPAAPEDAAPSRE